MKEAKPTPLIDRDAAHRLCRSLIKDYQTAQIRAGRMPQDVLVSTVLARGIYGGADCLSITEDHLGIDSLGLLDLVMAVNRYFGLAETGVEDYLLVRKTLGEWSDLILHHFEAVSGSAKITFATSGSSGPPKYLEHPRSRLDTEVAAIARQMFADTAQTARIISAVPPHHIYGFLWSVLLPLHRGLDCIDLHEDAPSALVRNARAGDIILATPYLWEKFATFGLTLPKGVTGVTSGGPTNANTWRAAATVGLGRMIEVYGSTETGGIGWRDDQTADYTLLPHLVRVENRVIRQADESACVLQDRLHWSDQTAFSVTGRLDRVVQVAGTNVNLGLVEQTLCAVDDVHQSAVRLDGHRLKAFVVPIAGAEEGLEKTLREHVQTLAAVARPDHFTFGDTLPRNATGKLQDW